ncbi:hypothetical protein H9P43_009106 [Blastocladiella emersonii ATCC 22665]|nr:hypothetical protein H9P43_009106 [Blastocladiella emersonii ATCC 22665]
MQGGGNIQFDDTVLAHEEAGDRADAKSGAPSRRTDLNNLVPVNALEQTVFQVAYITTRDNEHPPALSWALTFVEEIQWTSFAFNKHLHHDLSFALAAITEPTRLLTDYFSYTVANAIAVCMVVTTILLIMIVSSLMHRQMKAPISALQTLRLLCTLLCTALSIPITGLFMVGIHCIGGVIPEFNVSCTSSQHLPLLIFDSISLAIFIPLILVGSVVFIECSPTSKSPLARAHGRTDLLAVSMRITFVFLDVFLRDLGTAGKWAYMVLVAAGLAYLSLQFARAQPYFDARMTMLRIGLTMAACMSMVASMIVHAVGEPEGAWLALIPAAILGFVGGAYGSKWSADHQLQRVIKTWHRVVARGESAGETSPESAATSTSGIGGASNVNPLAPGDAILPLTMSTLRRAGTLTRRMSVAVSTTKPTVQTTLETTILSSGLISPGTPSQNGDESPARPASTLGDRKNRRHSTVSRAFETLAHSTAAEPSGSALHTLFKGTSTDALNAAKARQPKRRENVFDSALQVEVCIRFLRDNPSPTQHALALELLERGLIEHPKHPLLLLLAATYLAAYYGPDGAMAASELLGDLKESRHGVPLDVKFLAYLQERSARDRGEHVLDRTALDALARECRRHHLAALAGVRDLWEAIRTGATTEFMATIVMRLAESQTGARKCYRRILERSPRDKQTLRSYAQFLACVDADTARSAQILELAEEVESYESQLKTMALPSVVSGASGLGFGLARSYSRRIQGSFMMNGGDMSDSGPPAMMHHSPSKLNSSLGGSTPLATSGGPGHPIPPPPPLVQHQLASASSAPGISTMPAPGTGANSPQFVSISTEETTNIKSAPALPRLPSSNAGSAGSLPMATGMISPNTGAVDALSLPTRPTRTVSQMLMNATELALSVDDFTAAQRGQQPLSGDRDRDRDRPFFAGARAPSHTSGTSISRAERQKMQLRRLLQERVAAPLRKFWRALIPGLLLLIGVSMGFITCLHFFSLTSEVLSKFAITRANRSDALDMLKAMRGLVFANINGNRDQLASYVTLLNSTLKHTT